MDDKAVKEAMLGVGFLKVLRENIAEVNGIGEKHGF